MSQGSDRLGPIKKLHDWHWTREVVDSAGVIRYIGRIVSGIVIFLGYLWMIWDGEKQTWHDKMAGSVVVPTDSYPT